MSNLSELERRITAALERIGNGLEGLSKAPAAAPSPPKPQAQAGELASLKEALAAEKDANSQLSERLRAVKEQHETATKALERKVEKMTEQLDVQGLELQRMRKTSIQLRENLRALRASQEAGVADPQALNKSMVAELEALRATRMTEMAEMDEILSELQPLIGESNDA